MASKTCTRCGLSKPLQEFGIDRATPTGYTARCKKCRSEIESARQKKAREDFAAQEQREADVPPKWPNVEAFDRDEDLEVAKQERAQRRRESEFQALTVDDFDVGLGGDPRVSHDAGDANRPARARAAADKRQEYNEAMGRFATDLRESASTAHERDGQIDLPPHHAAYIDLLAEQEKRHQNRRWARSIAIAEAHEEMSRRAMRYIAERYFADRIEPTGYARIRPDRTSRRTVTLLLSDLHLGSELDSLDEPMPFRAIEEARRLEYLLRQFVDYKPQYRDRTDALLILNGDLIEGQLLHDLRAGAPLAEQKAIFWSYFREFIGQVAAAYPRVRVECQPGNHGRDKVRHPGRATSRKWDGHEWEMYIALREMCRGLQNVEWSIPFRAVSIIDVHGSKLGVTHADTEIKLGDPDTRFAENARILGEINSTLIYGVTFDAWLFGHYHKPRYQPRNPKAIWNGALVPPNGHARSSGYVGEPQGQFMFESVEGHCVGDLRFIEVGRAQDTDERLGTIIKPFRFSSE